MIQYAVPWAGYINKIQSLSKKKKVQNVTEVCSKKSSTYSKSESTKEQRKEKEAVFEEIVTIFQSCGGTPITYFKKLYDFQEEGKKDAPW